MVWACLMAGGVIGGLGMGMMGLVAGGAVSRDSGCWGASGLAGEGHRWCVGSWHSVTLFAAFD